MGDKNTDAQGRFVKGRVSWHTGTKDNLIYTCNKCNNSKNAKSLEELCGLTVENVLEKVGAVS